MTMTRRGWLRGVVAAGLGGSAGVPCSSSRAAEPVPTLPFGFSLYGMKGIKTADALSACAEIGYDGVELVLLPGWPTEPKRLTVDERRDLSKRLADSGLALLGLMENLTEPADDATHRANLDRLKAASGLGHALSPNAPPVIETILGGKPAQWEKIKERLTERLTAWAEIAAAAKTVVAVKPHVANALHTPEGAQWLLKQVNSPWLKLAFDYSHFVLRELPLDKTVTALAPDSVFIHVKDAKGNAEKFEFLLPGEGGIDYVDYFKRLQVARFRGPIVVEVSGQISNRTGYDPIATAKRCYANLAPAFQKAGLRRK